MRVKLKGLARATKKDASGKVIKTYYYAWRGRGAPLIADENGQPIEDPDDPRFLPAYVKARENAEKPSADTFASLIAAFRTSSDFKMKAEKTRKSYSSYIKIIEDEFGNMPLDAVQQNKARGEFKEWRDTMAETPRHADYAWTVLARILSFGKDRGKIAVNVCERGGRLYQSSRAEKIWTDDDIQEFTAVASPQLQAALMLAIWTGQREGDLLKLTWSNYDGEVIRLRQSKTDKRVIIPVGKPLKELLGRLKASHEAAMKKTGSSPIPETILITSRGLSWTEDGFRASWNKSLKKTTLGDLHFHDLRGTAVTRLASAGCTVPEIASITGHSLKDAGALLDAHYLGGRKELARSAIKKLDAAYGDGKHKCATNEYDQPSPAIMICETCGREIRVP